LLSALHCCCSFLMLALHCYCLFLTLHCCCSFVILGYYYSTPCTHPTFPCVVVAHSMPYVVACLLNCCISPAPSYHVQVLELVV
jgi:hypothetical protein